MRSVTEHGPSAFLAPMLSRSRSVVERSAPMPFSSCAIERNPPFERGSFNIARSLLFWLHSRSAVSIHILPGKKESFSISFRSIIEAPPPLLPSRWVSSRSWPVLDELAGAPAIKQRQHVVGLRVGLRRLLVVSIARPNLRSRAPMFCPVLPARLLLPAKRRCDMP